MAIWPRKRALTKEDIGALVDWLAGQPVGGGFSLFMEMISEQRESLLVEALSAGDTDYTKGQVQSLRWVLDLPSDLLRTSTGADT